MDEEIESSENRDENDILLQSGGNPSEKNQNLYTVRSSTGSVSFPVRKSIASTMADFRSRDANISGDVLSSKFMDTKQDATMPTENVVTLRDQLHQHSSSSGNKPGTIVNLATRGKSPMSVCAKSPPGSGRSALGRRSSLGRSK